MKNEKNGFLVLCILDNEVSFKINYGYYLYKELKEFSVVNVKVIYLVGKISDEIIFFQYINKLLKIMQLECSRDRSEEIQVICFLKFTNFLFQQVVFLGFVFILINFFKIFFLEDIKGIICSIINY